MKEIIESNYKSIVKRGLITPQTTQYDFTDQLHEEYSEFCHALFNNELENNCNINEDENLMEELADVILVCLNFAKHFNIDIETELKKKIKKNNER